MITGVTLRNGRAAGDEGTFGGAIRSGFGDIQGATLILDTVVVEDNSAGSGGGVSATGFFEATDSVFRRNEAVDGEGGGVYFVGSQGGHLLALVGVQITGNDASDAGGGVAIFGPAEIEGSAIDENSVTTLTDTTGYGGGIHVEDSNLAVRNSTINGNTAVGRGGGMMVVEDSDDTSNVTIENSTIDGNTAGSGGGGIRIGLSDGGGGHVTLTNSTVSNNTGAAGGGIYNFGSGHTSVLSLLNVTISGNHAATDGGGLRSLGPDAATTMNFTTIANNEADSDDDSEGVAGGIFQGDDSAVEIKNTILAGNTAFADPDCSGTVGLAGRNIVGETSDGCNLTGAGGDLLDVDPLISSLENNGGDTMTRALLTGSPGIDAGTDCPPPVTDQRGVSRPQGDDCDLGAFEAISGLMWGDIDCSGEVQPADALPILLYNLAGGVATGQGGHACPGLEDIFEFTSGSPQWGNVACQNGDIGLLDVLAVLKWYAHFEYERSTFCPQIGEPLDLP